MTFLPDFHFGVLNAWLPFAAYIIVFGITIFSFSTEVRARLYDRSLWTKKQIRLTVIGKLFSLTLILLFIITPLRMDSPLFWIGASLWTLGLVALVIALLNYNATPLTVPVTRGIYQISRNPQIFSIWLIFAGICLMTGAGLLLLILTVALLFLHNSVLAEEEACIQQYGDSYKEFMGNAPRYFLVF